MKSKSFKAAIAIAVTLVFFLIPNYLLAGASPEIKSLGIDSPKQVLFIGNSYLYYGDSLHNHVVRMAKAADKENEKAYSYK